MAKPLSARLLALSGSRASIALASPSTSRPLAPMSATRFVLLCTSLPVRTMVLTTSPRTSPSTTCSGPFSPDAEYLLTDSVSPETWIGRPVAFVVEQASYETEEGEERFYNIIKPHTVRKPTNEELADLQERFKGSTILAAQKQASEAKALAAAPAKNGGNEEVEEGDLEQAPF